MRTLALLVAVQAAGVLLPCARAQVPDSLPAGWRRPPDTRPYSIQLDRQVKHGGLSSARIHSEDASREYTSLRQGILADDYRGRRVRLTGYARVADVRTASVWMFVESATVVDMDNGSDRWLSGTEDWRRCEIVLDVPADAVQIFFGGWIGGPGTLWIDDFAFEVVDRTVPTTSIGKGTRSSPSEPDLPRSPQNLGFEPPQEVADRTAPAWERREAMIPMRDGIRLFTVIMAPRSATEPLPILLQRTVVRAGWWQETGPVWPGYRALAADGYVFASQSIRGRGPSEGAFVMNRPPHDSRDSTGVDETTDAYDTVEWLIHNVPNNNGRVGISGISSLGWLAEVVLLGPHPAVKAVSPQAPMTDTWMGDDFFHQGAFRQTYGLGYSWGMEGEMAGAGPAPITRYDTFEWYLSFGSLKELTDATGAMRIPTWRRFVEHPAYDSVWQGRAFQRLVTQLRVPTLSVGGWWDEEDLFGPQATYAALERFDTAGINSLVIGPWSHGQWFQPGGQSLGNLRFGSATADTFRLTMEAPFFAYWLKGRGDGRFPEARLFDAGANRWRAFDRWPPREATVRQLYFQAGGRLSFAPPAERVGFDDYISDPAHPVPYLSRPIESTYARWGRWMTEDQRFVDGRQDVLTWQTDSLLEDVVIAGNIVGRLFASTTGSDADWVVKLIDVYPDSVPGRPNMGGYQLMVAGDIMRGRYRRSFERPEAIRPNAVASYTVDLHQQSYTFRRGHRIMVQVQSTWFPLYDRNPQTYVPNIFLAPASAYRAQTHRIYRTAAQSSHVEVMVLPTGSTPP